LNIEQKCFFFSYGGAPQTSCDCREISLTSAPSVLMGLNNNGKASRQFDLSTAPTTLHHGYFRSSATNFFTCWTGSI